MMEEVTAIQPPNPRDVAEFVRDYPGRPGAGQLDTTSFLQGKAFLPLFIRLGGLQPTDDVLDVGCGAGRMAYVLTSFLDGGTYEGFDTIEGLVRWASRAITPAFPAFHFRHLPLHNRVYAPEGAIAPDTFLFPYGDRSFDFAILTSVFTHMRGAEIRHYLDELARVLRPGGRAFATWFLLDPEADAAMREGRARYDLRHPVDDGFTHEPANPELAIGYRTEDVLRWVAGAGLETVGVYPGNWSGRKSEATGQDLVVAQKADRAPPKRGSSRASRGRRT